MTGPQLLQNQVVASSVLRGNAIEFRVNRLQMWEKTKEAFLSLLLTFRLRENRLIFSQRHYPENEWSSIFWNLKYIKKNLISCIHKRSAKRTPFQKCLQHII